VSVKILGGLAKGQSLFVPKGVELRPTSVRLRRRLFDSHQNWDGMIFVDACAGTGAVGVEAWSRGCEQVFLVEANKKSFENLKKNVSKLSGIFSSQEVGEIQCVSQYFEKWLNTFKQKYISWNDEERENTVIFFDPPYKLKDLYKKVILEQITQGEWFKGTLWIESDSKKGLAASFWEEQGLVARKVYSQGDSYVFIVDFF
jgi:16S rRNA (guanine966-N2)-methyltransferase